MQAGPRTPRRVVTPASPVSDEALAAGVSVAHELGLELELELGLAGERHYLAGDDATRASALVSALSGSDQVWMARGGYGSARAVLAAGDGLRQAWRCSLWAFSDGTALLARAYTWGKVAWSAPPLVQLPRLDAASRARLVEAMRAGVVAPIEGLEVVGSMAAVRTEAKPTQRCGAGVAGRLFVANLAVLASLVGTPLMPSLEGALLVVEDVNEPAFRVDRFFWQLMAAGALRGLAGLIAGEFTGVAERERATIGMVLAEVGAALAVPVASGLPVGHGEVNACLPVGRMARLGDGRLEVFMDGVGIGGAHA